MNAIDTPEESAIRSSMRVHVAMRDYSDKVLAKVAKLGYEAVFGNGDGGITDDTWNRIFREELVKACRVHCLTSKGRRAGDPLSGRS